MHPMLQVLLIALVAFAGYRIWLAVRDGGFRPAGGGPRGHKCATCRHRGKLFDDGVLCQYAGKEVFKNQVHISNCIDYEQAN